MFYCDLRGWIKGIFRAIYCMIMQHSITFILNGHYRKNNVIQNDYRNTITQNLRHRLTADSRLWQESIVCHSLFASLAQRQSLSTCRLPQHLGKTKGLLGLLLLFRLSIQLCRLWSAHSFEDFIFSGIIIIPFYLNMKSHQQFASLFASPKTHLHRTTIMKCNWCL